AKRSANLPLLGRKYAAGWALASAEERVKSTILSAELAGVYEKSELSPSLAIVADARVPAVSAVGVRATMGSACGAGKAMESTAGPLWMFTSVVAGVAITSTRSV